MMTSPGTCGQRWIAAAGTEEIVATWKRYRGSPIIRCSAPLYPRRRACASEKADVPADRLRNLQPL